jgi:hypothetical protein
MGAMNPTSDISGYITDIYEDAWFIAREMAVMPRLVTSFNDTSDESKPRVSSTWGYITITGLHEADDLQSQAFTPSEVNTLTPAEFGARGPHARGGEPWTRQYTPIQAMWSPRAWG